MYFYEGKIIISCEVAMTPTTNELPLETPTTNELPLEKGKFIVEIWIINYNFQIYYPVLTTKHKGCQCQTCQVSCI